MQTDHPLANMSRSDLDRIQLQLKVAIQNHQILVSRMKADPQSFQNSGVQKQLHEKQAEITALSEKQKSIVQHLRKELVNNVPQRPQLGASPPPAHCQKSQVASHFATTKTVAPPAAHRATVNHNNHHQAETPPSLVGMNDAGRAGSPSDGEVSPKSHKPSSQTRVPSPPIRVPLYQRTSIMQGRKPVHLKSQVTPALPARKATELEVLETKKSTIEKSHLPPEEKKKLEYMASLDLITPETLKELQTRRSERKRRSTANPQFSYSHYESERKRPTPSVVPKVAPPQTQEGQKRRGRPPKRSNSRPPTPVTPVCVTPLPIEPRGNGMPPLSPVEVAEVHDESCAVCHKAGQVLQCDTCTLVYHSACLEPPPPEGSTGLWSCPKCVSMNRNVANWPGSLALVHTYITHKAAKEEEKKKMLKRTADLLGEKTQLEVKAKQISNTINKQIQQKAELLNASRNTQQSVDKLKNFMKVFQST